MLLVPINHSRHICQVFIHKLQIALARPILSRSARKHDGLSILGYVYAWITGISFHVSFIPFDCMYDVKCDSKLPY